jgi:hypothetical protein
MEKKPWHLATLEEFCRTMPLRAVTVSRKSAEERKQFVDKQVASLKKILEALLVDP